VLDNFRGTIKRPAVWLADHELWLLVLVVPLLLFPRSFWPWIGLGILVISWLARWVAYSRLSVTTTIDIPLVILILMALVGLFISVEPVLSAPRFWSLLLGVGVFYAFANTLKAEKQVLLSVYLLGLVTLGVALLSVLGTDWHSVRMLSIPWLYDRLPNLVRGLPGSGISNTGDLFNPRWVGNTMAFLVPPFLALLLFAHHRKLRIFSALVVVVGLLMLLISQSLPGMVGLVAGVFLILLWRWRWFWIALPLGVLGLVLGVVALGPLRVASYLLSVENPVGIAIALRLDIYSRALAMIRDLPYTGIGLNNFPVIQTNFYPGFLLGPEPHAHNLYLHTALDFGLVGLFALLWLVFAWAFSVRRNYLASSNWDYQVLLVGLAAGVLSYFAHGLVDGLMLGAKPLVALWMMLAMGAAVPVEHALVRGKNLPVQMQADLVPSRPAANFTAVRWLPVLLLTLILLLSLLIKPAAWRMNLGAIQAHRALYLAQTAGVVDRISMERARDNLLRVLDKEPQSIFAYDLLGRLYAWSGDYPASLETFEKRVLLDSRQPWRNYYPPEAYIRLLGGEPNYPGGGWDALQKIYSHWMNRYPLRAEGYLRMSLLLREKLNDPDKSARVLARGLEAGAQPLGLLEYAMQSISP